MDAFESSRFRRVKYLIVRALASPHRLPQWIALVALMRRFHRDRVVLPALAVPGLRRRERLLRLRSALLATHTKPHVLFDPEWYRWLNSDTEKVPPLLHYVLYGHREGRSTHPLVDPDWLTRSRPDIGAVLGETVRLEALNPFLQGLISNSGSLDDVESTEFFDASWQSIEHPDVMRDWASIPRAVDCDIARGPLAFWTHRGRAMGLPPSPLPVRIEKNWSKSDASIRALLAESSGQTIFRVVATPVFEDSIFSGATAVAENRLILDEALGLAHHPEALEWLGEPEIGRKSRDFALHSPDVLLLEPRRMTVVNGPVVHFLHEYASNYFHAMVEVAARLARYLDSAPNERVTALLDDTLPASVKELILGLIPSSWQHVMIERGCAIRAPEIVYPRETAKLVDRYRGRHQASELRVDGDALRSLLARIERNFPQDAEPAPPHGCSVLLSRNSSYRRLLNFRELEHSLSSRGFRTYSPSGTVIRQRDVFRDINVLVTPTGASLTNILFMRPGTHVIVLSSDHEAIATALWDQLASVSGVRVTHVRGPAQNPRNSRRELSWHHDFSVDVAALLQAVET